MRAIAFALLLACAAGAQEREVHSNGISLRYDARDFTVREIKREPKVTAKDNGDGVPEGVAPERTRISFASAGRSADPLNYVLVTPLRDATERTFSDAYPDVAAAERTLHLVLPAGRTPTRKQLETADLCVDSEISLSSRLERIQTAAISGFAFLGQFTQENDPNPANSRELRYVFVGLTADGGHLVEANFAVSHPALPRDPAAEGIVRDRARQYLRRDEKKLAGFAGDSFQPPLDRLKSLIRSIAVR